MRRISVIIFYIFVVNVSIAQHYTIDLLNNSASSRKAMSKNKGTVYNFAYQGIVLKEIKTPDGVYNQMFVPNTYRTGKLGEPQLVSTQKLVEIPAESQVSIRVISYTTDDYVLTDYYADNKLIPYQPSYSKNETIQDKKLVMNENVYKQNAFSKSTIASIKILGTLRDKKIAKITINPTSYNPVSNTLRFYNNIEVELIVTKSSKAKSIDARKTFSPYFNSTYRKIESVMPDSKYVDHPDLTGFPVKYLIVAPNNYVPGLQEFIKWKTQKGFEVVVGNLSVIGSTATAIKTWVHNQYNSATAESPAPSFLLLVGDIQQIPASQLGVNTLAATDLYYASVDSDMFPDMYYGRLPAQDTAQLRTMLAKTVFYEKYKFADDSFLNDVTLIAGWDSDWNGWVAQPTIKYGTTNYFNVTHGFNNVNSYLSPSYTGCYDNNKVAVSMINYTAHCSSTLWVNPSLTAASAKTKGNAGEYAVAIANCCQSANFSINECMGEAWLRNTNAGAIAYLGSVPDTYWYEDFYWSVGAHAPVDNEFPLVENSSLGVYDAMFGTEYQSVDAMVFVGNLAVTEAHNEGYWSDTSSLYYWEAYHCLGDPSIIPYLTKGINNTVLHNNSIRFGIPSFQVSAAQGSTVALSNKNGLIGTAICGADGIASIATDTVSINDSITIVVTKPKYKPYIKSIPFKGVVGIQLDVEQIKVNDLLGNSNGKFDVAEVGNLDISVKNNGNLTAKNCWVTITSNDKYLKTFANNIKIPLDSVKSDSTVSLLSKFNFQLKDSVPDQHAINFTVLISDSVSGGVRVFYTSQFNSVINAPKFEVLSFQKLDDFLSNGNHIIDYGETATLQLAVINKGHAVIQADALLSNISLSKTIQITTSPLNLGQINLNDTVLINFEIYLPLISTIKTDDTLLLRVEGGQYSAESEFHVAIGQCMFTELGDDKLITSDYPFNNHYKNNLTQILYLENEMGIGVKAIKSVAFDISQFTSDVAYRHLNNFKIMAALTTISELTGKMELVNPQLVYSNSLFNLPASLGWEKFDFQNPIILPDNRNIIFEISWGTTDNIAPTNNYTKINTSTTTFKSVVWGVDNDINPAPITESSFNRPNSQFEFDSVGILNISVSGNLPLENSSVLSNCKVTIGSESKLTDLLGRAQFYFLEFNGNYKLAFSTYGYYDSTLTINKTKQFDHAQIELRRHPELKICVKNKLNNAIENAEINIGGTIYHTNSQGIAISYATAQNKQALYSINKIGYAKLTDSTAVNANEKAITVILEDNVRFYIHNGIEGLKNAQIKFDTLSVYTDSLGFVSINKTILGTYKYAIQAQGYYAEQGSIEVGYSGIFLNQKMTFIPDLFIKLEAKNIDIQAIPIYFGNDTLFANEKGLIEFIDIGTGTFNYRINQPGYYQIIDSVHITNENVNSLVYLNEIPDLYFIVLHSGEPIVEAKISINDSIFYTNAQGECRFTNLLPNKYTYSIQKMGFLPYSDTLTISDLDYREMVELQVITVQIDESLQTLKIYPNPNKGEFYIDAETGLIGDDFTIVDNYGKIVQKGKIMETPQKITILNSQGVYYLQLYLGSKIISKRIVLE